MALQGVELTVVLRSSYLAADRPDRPLEASAPGTGHRDVHRTTIAPAPARHQTTPGEACQEVTGRSLIHAQISTEIGQGDAARPARHQRKQKRLLLDGQPSYLRTALDRVVEHT